MRDSVSWFDRNPKIVSISDVHGYFEEARSALLALGEHPKYEPVVEEDEEGKLRWAENNYVLVFNGDMIDRGPRNAESFELVKRLQKEAPEGRVRFNIGNHEEAAFFPDLFNHWDRWYSVAELAERRDELLDSVIEGDITVAYEGYNYTYVHAGAPNEINAHELNDSFVEATRKLKQNPGIDTQEEVFEKYSKIFNAEKGRGPGSGVVWLDFEYMPINAPPQIIGHTMHNEVTKKGDVICENVIRQNRKSIGGEAVLVETHDEVVAIIRTENRVVEEKIR